MTLKNVLTKVVSRAIIDKHSKNGALKNQAENRFLSAKGQLPGRKQDGFWRGKSEKISHSESRMTVMSKKKASETILKEFQKKLKKSA